MFIARINPVSNKCNVVKFNGSFKEKGLEKVGIEYVWLKKLVLTPHISA